ncbi:PAS domain-containing protein, partial [bacterium]|nr:PAS domain-containing protein [bacterium]
MTVQKTEPGTPALIDLLDLWLARSQNGAPPRASALSPVDLRPWKDHLVVFEVAADDVYVYTYYGQALVEAFGRSRLGATLDELPDSQRTILASEYAAVIAERLPTSRVHTADFDGRTRSFERLVLPLLGDGDGVDKLLAVAYEIADPPP